MHVRRNEIGLSSAVELQRCKYGNCKVLGLQIEKQRHLQHRGFVRFAIT